MAVPFIKTTIYVSGGAGSTPDATATTNGKVRLAGALGGAAAAPTVFGLASRAELEALILELAGGTPSPAPYMPEGYVADGYVQ